MEKTSFYDPVGVRLNRVSERLLTMSDGQQPFIRTLLEHVFSNPGKRVRPALTLLTSGYCEHDEAVTETMATAVEMLHIATLIHDDTVDDSSMRRGRATISSIWGDNAAVLVGDFIFAASATLVCDTGNIRVIKRFAETIMELAAGQLQESSLTYQPHQTMNQYIERIYNKTASLFMTASESGAVLSGMPEPQTQALREYGYNLGMAFQIIDDILDIEGSADEIGKPVGSDLSNGIVTLPTLIAIQKNEGVEFISDLFKDPENDKLLNDALGIIRRATILDESYKVANNYCDLAMECLNVLPQSDSTVSLSNLIDYIRVRRS